MKFDCTAFAECIVPIFRRSMIVVSSSIEYPQLDYW